MARGGIYDHLGGGICRYSTDPEWLVPHFEKMLYDQALVSSIYLDAYLVTKKRAYADVARDILEYVIADLQAPEGGFYSSRDADSDGLEGAFYVWTVEQVREVLGEDDARLACAFYDVTESGNWFERMGHAPTIVGDGAAAVEAVGRERFDLVLMDVHMPEMDGLEAVRRIRAAEAGTGRRVPVVALTASALKGDLDACREAGFTLVSAAHLVGYTAPEIADAA